MDDFKARPANSAPITPLGFLERASTVYGDCKSIIYNDTSYTWSNTHRRCLQMASSLVKFVGIRRRQVVSVVALNVPAMYELHFAVPMAGAILNSINTRLDARTISVLLIHAESKLVFVDTTLKSLVFEAISLFPPNIKPPILVLIDDKYVPQEIQSPTMEFYDTYEELLKKGDPEFQWLRPLNEREPIVLNYTSGTTSAPKGVVHCHRGAFIVTLDCLIDWTVPKQPVFLWTLAMFHSNGWSFPWGMAAVGGTNICVRKFDGPIMYDLINKHGVTHMCGAPVVLNMLANSPKSVQKLKSPVHVLTAGAPPPAAILSRAESIGFILNHGYGMTETGGIVISCAWKERWNHLPESERAQLKARQGVRTIGMTEVDVVDPTTNLSVKRDGKTLGEIVLRGRCLMLGYFKDPKATGKAMSEDGWLYTGDVAVMHPDGYLEIKDRSKDVIISGGENISSVEVESVLYTYPLINEAAVVARPDEYWGETPCAFVSLIKSSDGLSSDSNLIEKDIIEYCRAKMPHYMVPKTVVINDELPKTSTGKIQKFVLREMARAMGTSTLSRL